MRIEPIGKLAGGDDGDALELAQRQEVLVAGDDAVRAAGQRSLQHCVVVRISATGEIVYMPPEAADVPALMADLVTWLAKAEEEGIPVPVIAGLAHYQFVTIHPFYDGNGRTARALATLILYRHGYDLGRFYALEEAYAQDLAAYYAALQTHPHHNYYEGRADADLTGWVTYFVSSMAAVFVRVAEEVRTAAGDPPAAEPPELRKLERRARIVLGLLTHQDTITSADVARALGLSQRTVRGLMASWLTDGWLEMIDPSRKARNAGYDANGNMTSRLEDGKAYLLTYDAENRLTTVNNLAIGQTTTFTYDGDGNRVKVAVGSTTTVYIGNYYEKNTSTGVITKYYYAASQRVAMRAGSTLYYLFSDHLGSSSVSLRATDQYTVTQRYYPWGTIRPGPDNGLPTDYTFTGQKLDASTGLMYYVARYYDPVLGRFVSADTIVPEPGNPQALNRYSYTLNNPVNYHDPTGHWPFPLPPIRIGKAIMGLLNNPYIKPLWTNPQIGVPVSYAAYRQMKGDAPEALSLTLDWYFERGEEPRDFGLDSEITQFLITSQGMQEAREQFVKTCGRKSSSTLKLE